LINLFPTVYEASIPAFNAYISLDLKLGFYNVLWIRKKPAAKTANTPRNKTPNKAYAIYRYMLNMISPKTFADKIS